jgi:hypothetical protein
MMGECLAGKIISEQIIVLYNKNILNKDILECLVKPYLNTECNTDSFYEVANDGKDVHEIICLTMMPEKYNAIKDNLIFDEMEEQYMVFINSSQGYNLFNEIWKGTWGMW